MKKFTILIPHNKLPQLHDLLTQQCKNICAELQKKVDLEIIWVKFPADETEISKITDPKIIDSSKTFGLVITIILIVSSIIITFNTVRLAIYTSKDEIAVMQLVGASNAYIRGPFVFEGIMYGIISGFITLAIFYPLTIWLGPVTEKFFGNINIFTYFVGNFGRIFVIIVGSGVVLGAVSSYLAVRKYLKV